MGYVAEKGHQAGVVTIQKRIADAQLWVCETIPDIGDPLTYCEDTTRQSPCPGANR